MARRRGGLCNVDAADSALTWRRAPDSQSTKYRRLWRPFASILSTRWRASWAKLECRTAARVGRAAGAMRCE
jgi:hypothetical protein